MSTGKSNFYNDRFDEQNWSTQQNIILSFVASALTLIVMTLLLIRFIVKKTQTSIHFRDHRKVPERNSLRESIDTATLPF